MAFTPYVPPAQASPRARELGHRLADVVREYRQRNPGTSRADIDHALRIAAAAAGGGSPRPSSVILVTALGLLVLLGALAFLLFRSQ
jgi:hypothetical protein